MSDLILTEFDLSEFNKWMLTIQKASEDLNIILKSIKEMGYEEITLNDLLLVPEAVCNDFLSEKGISGRIFDEKHVDIFDFENPNYNDCIDEANLKSLNIVHLRKKLYRVHELLASYGFGPGDLFEEEKSLFPNVQSIAILAVMQVILIQEKKFYPFFMTFVIH